MISYFIQSGLILTLFYVVYRFLFVRFTFFQENRFFLLGGIFSSLFLPFNLAMKPRGVFWLENRLEFPYGTVWGWNPKNKADNRLIISIN